MPAGHLPGMKAAAWLETRRAMAGVLRWPEPLIEQDLEFWADALACDGKRRPTVRELADTWGCSKSVAGRLVKAFDARDNGGTSAGQARDNRPRKKPQNKPQEGQSRDSGGTAVGHPYTARASSSATSATSASLPSGEMGPGPPGDGDEDWERVKSAYAELRVAQGLEAFAPNPKRGIGRDLRMMINQYSADEAVEVLLHCARSPLTAWVRGDNKTGKKYPPKTIYRQFEELRDEARSKPRPRPRAPPRADDWRAVGRAGPEVEDGWSEPGASDEELLGLGMERCKCEGRGCERCYSETRMKGWLTGSLGAR